MIINKNLSTKKGIIAVSLLLLVTIAILVLGRAEQKTEQLIVQGASSAQMIEKVRSVGGEVNHTFKIINAIAASLTENQLAQLKKQEPLLSFFKDATVELEDINHEAKDSRLKFKIKKQKLLWSTKATSDSDLSAIEASWPEANGELVSLKINGKKVAKHINDNQLFLQVERNNFIAKNKKIKVEMKFANISSVDEKDYSITLSLDNNEQVVFTPSDRLIKQGKNRDTHHATLVRADEVHQMGITGKGVTVAVIDSGLTDFKNIKITDQKNRRNIYQYNVFGENKKQRRNVKDEYGHGTHVASLITDSSHAFDENGDAKDSYNGIAPSADLLAVKAFDQQGLATYSNVLMAIDYVVTNKDKYNVKVLNLSFSAEPSSVYWDDPINQALMVAWQEGITVIASSGNRGPEAMSVGVPGNNPYVITVGAVSDNYTPEDTSDDFVTSFSSSGPTLERFIKPELVAPGGHIQGLIGKRSFIAENFPMFDTGHNYFEISGTSQSTAITSGIVALMLEQQPDLTPDQIKCHLMYTAKMMVSDDAELAFSIFQQGNGLVDAKLALNATPPECSDNSEELALEIADEEHFLGPVSYNEDDEIYYVDGYESLAWDGVYTDGNLWGKIRYLDAAGNLWGKIRQVNAAGNLWGKIRQVNVSGNLWGKIRQVSVDGNLWGKIRVLNVNGNLWGKIRVVNVNGNLWGKIRQVNVNGNLWGKIRQGPSQALRTQTKGISSSWVEQE